MTNVLDGIGGLLVEGNPMFDIGLGLLAASGPSAQPPSLGQAFAHAAQFASGRGAERLKLESERSRLRAQGQLGRLLTDTTTLQGPSRDVQGMGGESIGSVPGAKAQVPRIATAEGRREAFGLLGEIAPDQITGGLLAQLMPQPSSIEQKIAAVESNIGRRLTPQETLQIAGGTSIHVGNQQQPSRFMSPEELQAAGLPPTTVATGGIVVGTNQIDPGSIKILNEPRQSSAAEDSRTVEIAVGLSTLDGLERAVREGNIQPGFISEGGISQFLASDAGQVLTTGGRLLGLNIPGLSPEQASALSLQEQLSNQLIAAVRGASVGPREQELFQRQLPRLTQDPEVFKANARHTRRNLELLAKLRRKQQVGEMLTPESISGFLRQDESPRADSSRPKLPSGSKQIGVTTAGLPVFESPNGKRFVVE